MELLTTPGLNEAPQASAHDQAAQTAAVDACARYASRLPIAIDDARALLRHTDDAADTRKAMADLHHALAGEQALAFSPAQGSIEARAQLTERPNQPTASAWRVLRGLANRRTAPPVQRTAMEPQPWGELNPFKLLLQKLRGAPTQPSPARVDQPIADAELAGLSRAGRLRRGALVGLMLAQTAAATYVMRDVLPQQGGNVLEAMVLVLFAVLFCWVSAGFWTALMGFSVLLRGGDRYLISRHAADKKPIAAAARTAIVMPICNEDVSRVFAGLRATYESLANTGELDRFDFFVLSDSNDADICVAELDAWQRLRQQLGAEDRLHYRRRQRRVKRKSGNLDDFCRRWGGQYRYMVVLDADSVMNGDCLTTLVRLMERRPDAGIIQTAPSASGRDTLYARMQQFASRVYGPLFTAGLHYWQMGESHYWGHNAIIRLEPFIKHCALAAIPGEGSLSGEILSHDFVEAALMRRAGYGVWIAYDLAGSYEETPPNLLDELTRDRRWCHGNLMNFRLFFARGIRPTHRAVFLTGIMAYLSAPLWLLFLLLSSALVIKQALTPVLYFHSPHQLFPAWPVWNADQALALFSATALLLFLPKVLSVALIIIQGAERFGGAVRLSISALLETVFSALLAPVRMLFHTRFVLAALCGWSIQWKSPPRDDAQTPWREGIRRHGAHSLFGAIWVLLIGSLDAGSLAWLLPVAGALMLSIPLSVLSSRVSIGYASRRTGLFLIPDESKPPIELIRTRQYTDRSAAPAGFTEAVTDPVLNALVCAAVPAKVVRSETFQQQRLDAIRQALLFGSNDTASTNQQVVKPLSASQTLALINDPAALAQLHFPVWTAPEVHADWRNACAWQPIGRRRLQALQTGRSAGYRGIAPAWSSH